MLYNWKYPDCGATWKDYPYNQSRSRGCRECVKKTFQQKRRNSIILEKGSFAQNYPHLLNEWMYEKNAELGYFPDKLTEGSNAKVWRKCSICGHEFLISVKGWSKGQTCLYCKSLAFTHKDFVATVWDHTKNSAEGIFPENVTAGSEEKVWCKCQNNHSYKRPVYNVLRLHGCPICNKRLNTLLTERALALCLEKSNIKVERNKKFKYLKNSEIDIFLPEYNIAINYDGSYFYKDKIDLDTFKTSSMKENGLRVVRIRETPLPNISNADKNISAVFPPHGNRMNEMLPYINLVLGSLYLVLDAFNVKYSPFNCTENVLISCRAEKYLKIKALYIVV